jgi:hypothetical protein
MENVPFGHCAHGVAGLLSASFVPAAQSMHDVDLVLEYCPTAQFRQGTAGAPSLNFPLGQSVQLTEFGAAYWPGVQATQAVAGYASVSARPAAQLEHTNAFVALYCPGKQLTQGVAAELSISAMPATHGPHDDEFVGANVPGAHASHAVAGFES